MPMYAWLAPNGLGARRLGRTLVASLTLLIACDDGGGFLVTPNKTARVRFVHASPNAPAVDLLVDDESLLSAVPYRNATAAFLPVSPGARRIRVRNAGTNAIVIDTSLTFEAQASQTVIVTGMLAFMRAWSVPDDLPASAAGEAYVRIINAAPGATNVDVFVTAPASALFAPSVSNVPFLGVSVFLGLPAGTYRIRVTPSASMTVALDATVVFAAGQVRTVVLSDAPGGGAPLGAIVLTDRD